MDRRRIIKTNLIDVAGALTAESNRNNPIFTNKDHKKRVDPKVSIGKRRNVMTVEYDIRTPIGIYG